MWFVLPLSAHSHHSHEPGRTFPKRASSTGGGFHTGCKPLLLSSLPNPSGIPHWSNASRERSQQPRHLLARGGELRDLALALYLCRWLSVELRERKARSKQTNKQIWLFPVATAKGAEQLRARQAKPRPDSLRDRHRKGAWWPSWAGRPAARGRDRVSRGGVATKGAGRGLGVGGVGPAGRSAPTALAGATRAAAPRQAGFT